MHVNVKRTKEKNQMWSFDSVTEDTEMKIQRLKKEIFIAYIAMWSHNMVKRSKYVHVVILLQNILVCNSVFWRISKGFLVYL